MAGADPEKDFKRGQYQILLKLIAYYTFLILIGSVLIIYTNRIDDFAFRENI